MGLLRLLMRLFAPQRQVHRPRTSSPKHHPAPALAVPAPRPYLPQQPLRSVEEQTGQHVLKGHCWVIDGDTIVIDRTHIRLAGIDAPELDHPYGQNAKQALIRLCRGQVVTAIADGSTSHERVVAMCHLADGRDLSAEMVKLGFALDWAKHSGGRYRHLEVEGIRKKLWRVEARQKGRMPQPEKKGRHSMTDQDP